MRELSKETSLQRVMRASGRVPVQCSCSVCKQQCHTPCLGTPDDIERIIDAGYADRLALTNWAAGIFLGVINIAMVRGIVLFSRMDCVSYMIRV